jgi:hypothetical protein
LGVKKADKKNVAIHSFDRWDTDRGYLKKAQKWHNKKYKPDTDLMSVFMDSVKPFKVSVVPHKGAFSSKFMFEKDEKIAILVDDASSSPKLLNKILKVFSKNFVSGETLLLLMDYYSVEGKPSDQCK